MLKQWPELLYKASICWNLIVRQWNQIDSLPIFKSHSHYMQCSIKETILGLTSFRFEMKCFFGGSFRCELRNKNGSDIENGRIAFVNSLIRVYQLMYLKGMIFLASVPYYFNLRHVLEFVSVIHAYIVSNSLFSTVSNRKYHSLSELSAEQCLLFPLPLKWRLIEVAIFSINTFSPGNQSIWLHASTFYWFICMNFAMCSIIEGKDINVLS